nr:uncharacterized protein LOC111413434 [Onthophagus taurus]
MRWAEEETIKFVKLYRDHECLWNKTKPSYKNKNNRLKAIHNIMHVMAKEGFGVTEIKQKIKNIRSTYYQEVQKIKKSAKSAMSQDDIYQPNVKWFTNMDYIMRHSKKPSEIHNKVMHKQLHRMWGNINKRPKSILAKQRSPGIQFVDYKDSEEITDPLLEDMKVETFSLEMNEMDAEEPPSPIRHETDHHHEQFNVDQDEIREKTRRVTLLINQDEELFKWRLLEAKAKAREAELKAEIAMFELQNLKDK